MRSSFHRTPLAIRFAPNFADFPFPLISPSFPLAPLLLLPRFLLLTAFYSSPDFPFLFIRPPFFQPQLSLPFVTKRTTPFSLDAFSYALLSQGGVFSALTFPSSPSPLLV